MYFILSSSIHAQSRKNLALYAVYDKLMGRLFYSILMQISWRAGRVSSLCLCLMEINASGRTGKDMSKPSISERLCR